MRGAAVAALAILAGALRLPQLERRPMHADEAILADKFGTLLATGRYDYDPRDYHGPMLAYCTLPSAYLSGRTSYDAIDGNDFADRAGDSRHSTGALATAVHEPNWVFGGLDRRGAHRRLSRDGLLQSRLHS